LQRHIKALLARAGRRNLLNFASYIFSKTLSLGLFAFAVSHFVTHNGEQAYGIVSLILLLYVYLQMVDLGMGYAVVYRLGRAVARGGRSNWRIVAEAVPIYLACSVVIGTILVGFAKPMSLWLLGDAAYSRLFELAGIGVSLLIFGLMCVAVMQAYNRVYFVNLSRLVFDVFKAVALVASTVVNGGLEAVLWVIMIGALAKLALDISLASHLLGTTTWLWPRISRRSLALNMSVGAPMFVSSLSGSIINSVDQIVVAKLFAPAIFAVYSVVTDLHAKAYFLIWAVTGSLYTLLIHRQARRESVRNLILFAVLAILGALLVYYVPLTLFAHQILAIWISNDFADKGYSLLRWQLLPTGLYMIVNVMEVYLQTAGKTKRFGWVYFIALIVQTIGLALLPQRFGVIGVVWAVSMMYFSLVICFGILVIGKRRVMTKA
jgi:O-antigen/teichoic acid export membrane protein